MTGGYRVEKTHTEGGLSIVWEGEFINVTDSVPTRRPPWLHIRREYDPITAYLSKRSFCPFQTQGACGTECSPEHGAEARVC